MRRMCGVVVLMLALHVFSGVAEAAGEDGSQTTDTSQPPKKKPDQPVSVPQPSPPAQGEPPSRAKADEAPPKVNVGPPKPPEGTQPQAPKGDSTIPVEYDKAAKVMFVAFAIALFLESALAAIFNWRPFVQTFVRGTRTVVAFAVSLLLVLVAPRLNVFSELVAAMFPERPPPNLGFLGTILSALMFAGGSSGINTVLVALGFRTMRTPESVVSKPIPTEAWVSIRLAKTLQSEKPARVMMTIGNSRPQVIGIIDGISPPFEWMRYFLRDKGRFPKSGGFAVKGGEEYTFTVEGAAEKLGTWGPCPIAALAIVDIAFD